MFGKTKNILLIGNNINNDVSKYLETPESSKNITHLRIYSHGLSEDPTLFTVLRKFIKTPNVISKVCVVCDPMIDCLSIKKANKLLFNTLSIFNDVCIKKLTIRNDCETYDVYNFESLKRYLENTTSFKKVRLDGVWNNTSFDLIQCANLNESIEKIRLDLYIVATYNIELSTITKLQSILINNNAKTDLLPYYLDMLIAHPCVTELILIVFELTSEIMELIIAIINKNQLKKIRLSHYSLPTTEITHSDDFAKFLMMSQLKSISYSGRLGEYLLADLNLSTSLTNFKVRSMMNCNCIGYIDNIITNLSKSNIVNFYCDAIVISNQPYLNNDDKSNLVDRWENILLDNYLITSFYLKVIITQNNGRWFTRPTTFTLSNITNRNIDVATKTRFAKVKPIYPS